MTILNQLASALNRRDEIPNQELAKNIAQLDDKLSVNEIVDNLQNKDKNIQSDCIKTLDEIGKLKPKLIARLPEIEKDSKRKRVEKILKKIH